MSLQNKEERELKFCMFYAKILLHDLDPYEVHWHIVMHCGTFGLGLKNMQVGMTGGKASHRVSPFLRQQNLSYCKSFLPTPEYTVKEFTLSSKEYYLHFQSK